MARIPEFKRTFIPQGPTISPELAAAPFKAAASTASNIGKIQELRQVGIDKSKVILCLTSYSSCGSDGEIVLSLITLR